MNRRLRWATGLSAEEYDREVKKLGQLAATDNGE